MKKKTTTGANVPAKLGLELDFPARVTSTDLILEGHLSYEEGRQTLFKVKQVRGASQWWIAAMIVQGIERWGEEWIQAVSDAGIEPETAQRYVSVYTRIPETMRIKELDFSHHKEIAPLETVQERAEWLVQCHLNNWTVSELIQALIDAGLRKARTPKLVEEPEREITATPDSGNGASGPVLCACCGSEEGTIRIGGSCLALLANMTAGEPESAKG